MRLAKSEGAVPTVLLIDDDASTLMVMTAILEGRGLRIFGAEDEKTALQRCRTIGAIDVLVVDVVLQGITGPELVRKLQREQPAARILFISGFDLADLTKRGILSASDLREGAVEFLHKPFNVATLASAVDRLVGSASNSALP